jgi:hypothetical protein
MEDTNNAMETRLEGQGITLMGKGEGAPFCEVFGVDFGLTAKIEWDESEASEPLEREVHIAIEMSETYGMDLYLGETAAKALRDLLIRFFEGAPDLPSWKARN